MVGANLPGAVPKIWTRRRRWGLGASRFGRDLNSLFCWSFGDLPTRWVWWCLMFDVFFPDVGCSSVVYMFFSMICRPLATPEDVTEATEIYVEGLRRPAFRCGCLDTWPPNYVWGWFIMQIIYIYIICIYIYIINTVTIHVFCDDVICLPVLPLLVDTMILWSEEKMGKSSYPLVEKGPICVAEFSYFWTIPGYGLIVILKLDRKTLLTGWINFFWRTSFYSDYQINIYIYIYTYNGEAPPATPKKKNLGRQWRLLRELFVATGSCQKPQVPLVRQGSLKDSDFHQEWWFRGDIIWDIIDVELSWECGFVI